MKNCVWNLRDAWSYVMRPIHFLFEIIVGSSMSTQDFFIGSNISSSGQSIFVTVNPIFWFRSQYQNADELYLSKKWCHVESLKVTLENQLKYLETVRFVNNGKIRSIQAFSSANIFLPHSRWNIIDSHHISWSTHWMWDRLGISYD